MSTVNANDYQTRNTLDIDITQNAKGEYQRTIKVQVQFDPESELDGALSMESGIAYAKGMLQTALLLSDKTLVEAKIQDDLRPDFITVAKEQAQLKNELAAALNQFADVIESINLDLSEAGNQG